MAERILRTLKRSRSRESESDLDKQLRKLDRNSTTSLQLSGIESFPERLTGFPKLTRLSITQGKLSSVPAKISKLAALETLSLQRNRLQKLPDELGLLHNLVVLDIGKNLLKYLPDQLDMPHLRELLCEMNQLEALPKKLSGIPSLTKVRPARHMPADDDDMTQVYSLHSTLSHQLSAYVNRISYLPNDIRTLTNLQVLDLASNFLATIPDSIGGATSLTELNVCGNKLQTLPDSISQLVNLQKLDVRFNSIAALPSSISLPRLQYLHLADNNLTHLSDSIGSLNGLWLLNLQSNRAQPAGVARHL